MIKLYLKKTLLVLAYFLEFILAFFAVYFMIVCIGLLFPVNSDYKYSKDEIQFYVVSNGVHTDICLPVTTPMHDWSKFLNVGDYKGLIEQPKFISIGWGDKGFYLDTPTWADLKFSTAFNAAFLPSETAMHILYWPEEPVLGESVKLCSMDEQEYMNLIEFIFSSFEMENGFNPQLLVGEGYTEFDNFYEANYNYYLLKTCNTWTNQSLKIAGVKTSSLALFEAGILRWLD